jgi:hypothetical protein
MRELVSRRKRVGAYILVRIAHEIDAILSARNDVLLDWHTRYAGL